MAQVRFGAVKFDTDLIVFDKDGTLINFTHLWASKTRAAVDALAHAINASQELRLSLYASLGCDPVEDRFAPQSPVVTAPLSKLYTIAATVLYQHGFGWLDAEIKVYSHFAPPMENIFSAEMVEPAADIAALFRSLQEAGVYIAVITSDDRKPTEETLQLLKAEEYVSFIAAADDEYPHKPAPEAVLAACEWIGASPARTAVVGDSTTDLVMGRRAQVGLRVGVLTGVMDQATLAPYADVVLPSVGEISVAE